MISHATNNDRAQESRANRAMLQNIAQTVSMFGGQESRALFEKIYAKEIAVDYTAQREEDQSDCSLMAKWTAALPGFDHTRYTVSGVALTLQMQGSQLTAEVRVNADRWVDDLFLEIEKTYQHQVDSVMRPSQVLSRNLQALTDTGSWNEITIKPRGSKEIVENFLSEACLGNFAIIEEYLSETAVFNLPGETLQQQQKFHGREAIIACLHDLKAQGNMPFAKEGTVLSSLEREGEFFVQWKGGAGYFVVKEQKIVKLQTFLA